ncbi:recombinase family protein [Aeoliella sp. ICT_H6.2]|uniref:Recombinase family protein n=1 Tax=Aeoliella straminimaris TaxID=2954799 RepID=A0A9X2F6U1_9BACT|nr:recombinase family protein [Aeoliella straminimaris]MCO6043340.1 recombinase family protein [Aeoliella straminimaris]
MKYVAYYRVSTARQGQSGLGLEAQQAAVAAFCEPIESYTEIETGTNKRQRPELQRAIAACKRRGATLVVAKLDRLARNVAFVSTLMESGIEFVACDNPTANRLTVHILAAVAEDEARRISERTKAALAAYKARGGQLGNPSNLTSVAARKGNAANVAAAERHRQDVLPIARKLREAGRTYQAIAHELTGRGLLTRRGKAWSPTAVKRLLG